jgi:hypothetical protein
MPGGEVVIAQRRRLTEAQERLLKVAGFTGADSLQVAAPGARDEGGRVDGAEVPGLARVLDYVPAGWHPVSVNRFLHTPQLDLAIDQAPATPLEWLKHTDGDIAPVVRLVEIAEWTGR